MENKQGKHLKKVLKKMCDFVGADYNEIDFSSEKWFLQYSWTAEEEKQFEEWLVKYLKKHQEARKELLQYPALSDLDQAAFWFVFNYGWKLKEAENEDK